ncbi:hypothetical protein OF375_02110 [Ureaplasma miroungigenitalium]|uniref:hypothetical protein n=1 Tax=Ureaplasma miroungigenitalium TaxID=1042321 RepID=UPI0021E85386|nr:hypothetical protein [Ureaplasma miroungigenitalium]MCV3734360.1 hypothetical protein [Ureaplasma miroungigenitalium]
MINTKHLFLGLLKWLVEQKIWGQINHLKIHKFVFFYMLFAWLIGSEYDFSYLSGYTNGPVFTQIYGDYVYRYNLLNGCLKQNINVCIVSDRCAQKALFLVMTHTNEELKLLTHSFLFWNQQLWSSNLKEDNHSFCIDLLGDKDKKMVSFLYECCLDYEIVKIILIREKYFVMLKVGAFELSEPQIKLLETLSMNHLLVNPIYIHQSATGVLIID